jgi:hypothetical protein
VQPLAAWLVARPQNAVIALAVTLALPFLHLFSGIFMVLLVLRQGWRPAVVEGAIAGAILVLVYLLAGVPVKFAFVAVTSAFVPAVVLALVLQSTRSLALTMQVSALVAAVAVVALHIAIDDMAAYWEPVMAQMLEWAQVNSFDEQALVLQENPGLIAHMMTIGLVLTHWTMYALYLLFGYRYATMVPGETGPYGRFCDLSFGRVIALIFAIAAVLGYATGMPWLQSLAIVLFAVFWLQGLAVVHWMVVDGELPLFVVIMVYVLLPFLHVFLIMALAVVGYTDAWFGYRRRVVTSNEE